MPLNAIWSLSFPVGYLRTHGRPRGRALDPYSGRGMPNLGAGPYGMPSVGVDTSPIAIAISKANLATTRQAAFNYLDRILADNPEAQEIPVGRCWCRVYRSSALSQRCPSRKALLYQCDINAPALRRTGGEHGSSRA